MAAYNQQCPQIPPLGKQLRTLNIKCSCGVGIIRACANAHSTHDFKAYVCAPCETRFRNTELNNIRFEKIEELLRSHESRFSALEKEIAENLAAQTQIISEINSSITILKNTVELLTTQLRISQSRIDESDKIMMIFKSLFDRYHSVMCNVELMLPQPPQILQLPQLQNATAT